MDFYNYWKFFFEHTFAKEERLHFFDDGSFSIYSPTKRVSSYYSNDCELIEVNFNTRTFENGCTAREYHDHVTISFADKVLYKIPTPIGSQVLYHTNALTVFTDNCNYLYFIEPNQSAPEEFLLDKDEYAIETSTKKMVYGKKAKGDKWLMDQNRKRLPIDDIHRVDFLPCGSYIVFFEDVGAGCSLYNAEHVKLLHSEESFGIQSLGAAVSYQNALIIDPTNGKILGGYANEIAITESGVRVYPYTLKSSSSCYWLGGELIEATSRELGHILYYWHDGRFYFAPKLNVRFALNVEDKIADPNWKIYMQHIKNLMYGN